MTFSIYLYLVYNAIELDLRRDFAIAAQMNRDLIKRCP
jgi:hypothetical protein